MMMITQVTSVFYISELQIAMDGRESAVILFIVLFTGLCCSDVTCYPTIPRASSYNNVTLNTSGSEGWKLCGQDRCRCQEHVAKCTDLCGHNDGDHGNEFLKHCYIPKLPNEITSLDVSRSFYDLHVILNSDFFANVSHITYLDFSVNTVGPIRENPFELLTNLTTLVWNQVTEFHLSLLHPLSMLESLEMKGNEITEFPETCFNGTSSLFPALQTLSMGYNIIPRLPENVCLPSFTELSLRDNGITVISESTFAELIQLTFLDLGGNKIAFIADNAFFTLTSLNVLNLTRNEIAVLSDQIFSPEFRGQLRRIDFSHNKLVCNCSMLWFHTWFVHHREVFIGDDSI
jgi:Leucine-rich repeat (LRR) protein